MLPDCPVGPPTCWLWFSTLRLLIGKIPLKEDDRRRLQAAEVGVFGSEI